MFKDFPISRLPPYAILSHTWGDDEAVWEDFKKGTAAAKPSFSKVTNSCLQTIQDGLEWVWIDSCCIDKSSSAELSEAINSMYAWYQGAQICYAHLEGVSATVDVTKDDDKDGEFARCRWFTRGWTLQELLAPTDVVFFSEDWVKIGNKAALHRVLSNITGVDYEILTGARALESVSIAKRMSWAAHRQTTRPEDVAYSLMGIFGVNMPMLYGEGQNAFLRLQQEIMKQSDDHSLFAWLNLASSADTYHGLLARSPHDFAYSNSIQPYVDWEARVPYQVTNRGLSIDIPLTRRDEPGGKTVYVAALDCPVPPDYEDGSFLAIYLEKLVDSYDQYARVRAGQFAKVKERGMRETIYVKQNVNASRDRDAMFPRHIFQLRVGPPRAIYKLERLITDPEQDKLPTAISSSRGDAAKWLGNGTPRAFVAPKVPDQLAYAILLSRVRDLERVLIMVGTIEGMKVGYRAVELPPRSAAQTSEGGKEMLLGNELSFENLQQTFRERWADRLKYNDVRLDFQKVIADGAKYYLIDLYMEITGAPERFDEAILNAAGNAINQRTGRQQPTERPMVKKPSIWNRLITSKDENQSGVLKS